MRMDLLQKETLEKIEKLQEKINMDRVKDQVTINSSDIEEINVNELVNIWEELETIKNKPFQIPNIQLCDKRETINYYMLLHNNNNIIIIKYTIIYYYFIFYII